VGTTNPAAPIIPPNLGVRMMHLLGASSSHRQWYGPKLPTTMISGKRDVSCETAAKKRAAKVSLKFGTILLKLDDKANQCFRTHIKLVQRM
jgi:hypothetical protein